MVNQRLSTDANTEPPEEPLLLSPKPQTIVPDPFALHKGKGQRTSSLRSLPVLSPLLPTIISTSFVAPAGLPFLHAPDLHR